MLDTGCWILDPNVIPQVTSATRRGEDLCSCRYDIILDVGYLELGISQQADPRPVGGQAAYWRDSELGIECSMLDVSNENRETRN